MQPKSKEQQQHMKQNTLCSKRRSMILHTHKGCGIIVILEASPSPAARARHQNAHCSLTHRVQLTEWQAGAALAAVTIFQWFQSRHISSSKAVTNLSERGVRGREGGVGGGGSCYLLSLLDEFLALINALNLASVPASLMPLISNSTSTGFACVLDIRLTQFDPGLCRAVGVVTVSQLQQQRVQEQLKQQKEKLHQQRLKVQQLKLQRLQKSLSGLLQRI
jgi:hypothetical protein